MIGQLVPLQPLGAKEYMDENKKVLFIINKFSGAGYSPSVEGRIIQACSAADLECVIEFTKAPGHATELSRQAAQAGQYHRVFAVGGDGTVNEVAKGLVGSTTVMGILPKGSGNGLARHLGISMDIRKALSLLESDQVVTADTLQVNGILSVNVSGIGFDGHIAYLFGQNGKRGLAGYAKLVLREFGLFKEFDVHVECDNQTMSKKVFILALANSTQFGNNARIAPHASICDGLIDVCFIRKIPLTHALGFAYKMFSGNLMNSSFVEIVKAKNIFIRSSHPIAFHIDGEAHAPQQEFHVQLQPASLRMVVPPASNP